MRLSDHNMKKFFAAALAAAIVISFAGCAKLSSVLHEISGDIIGNKSGN